MLIGNYTRPWFVTKKVYSDLTGYDTATAFTVSGTVMAMVVGAVGATPIDASAACSLQVGTSQDPDAFLPATSINGTTNFIANSAWMDSSPTADVDSQTYNTLLILCAGDILLTRSVDNITQGALTLYCIWKPMTAGAFVSGDSTKIAAQVSTQKSVADLTGISAETLFTVTGDVLIQYRGGYTDSNINNSGISSLRFGSASTMDGLIGSTAVNGSNYRTGDVLGATGSARDDAESLSGGFRFLVVGGADLQLSETGSGSVTAGAITMFVDALMLSDDASIVPT